MAENMIQKIKTERTKSINWTALIVKPIQGGLFGFATFFIVVIFTKLLSSAINPDSVFVVEIDDVYLSLIGFVLSFLIKLLENFRSV